VVGRESKKKKGGAVDAAGCSSLLLVAAMVGLAAVVRLSLEAG
jgi:hypothetical protein